MGAACSLQGGPLACGEWGGAVRGRPGRRIPEPDAWRLARDRREAYLRAPYIDRDIAFNTRDTTRQLVGTVFDSFAHAHSTRVTLFSVHFSHFEIQVLEILAYNLHVT